MNCVRFCFSAVWLYLHSFFVCESNIPGTAEQICAKFTGKTCFVPLSDKFECQGQRSKVKVTRDKKRAVHSHHPWQWRNGPVCCMQHVTMHCQRGQPACCLCLVKHLWSSVLFIFIVIVIVISSSASILLLKPQVSLGMCLWWAWLAERSGRGRHTLSIELKTVNK